MLNDDERSASFTGNCALLDRLILYAESLPNVSKIFKADGREWEESKRYIKRSSAYTLCSWPSLKIPVSCVVWRNEEKSSDETLFVLTEMTGSVYSSLTMI